MYMNSTMSRRNILRLICLIVQILFHFFVQKAILVSLYRNRFLCYN